MTLEDISARLWDIRLELDPVSGSLLGFHERDSQLQDLSAASIESAASRLRSIADEARAIDTQSLNTQDRITRDLAIPEAEILADVLEGRFLVGAVDTFVGQATDLLLSVSSLSANNREESEAYAERWKQIPRLLDQTFRLNREEVAQGRPPARVVVDRVINMIDGYLATNIDDDPFAKATIIETTDDLTRVEVTKLVTEIIRPAFASYRQSMADEIAPFAKPDDKVGLTHSTDGDTVYEKLVHMYTSLPADPQELHDYGLADATEKLPAEWAEIGTRTLGVSDLPTLFDRLRHDPDLSYRSSQEMVDHATATIDRAWKAVDDWFGARPESPCDVVEVPAAIAKDLPPAFYMTPANDGSRPGLYYLNTHDPTSRKRFNYESFHFHEAIPGHHLDRSLSMELTGIPDFRKYYSAFAHVEGWGLYAERLADEMGLYTTDMDRLGMLAADAWRAGRLVVDTGMHAMGWSRQKAIDWMVQWTPIPLSVIEQEVDRYIGMAGQALAYKTGQREIFRLRDMARDRLGVGFDIKGFHDAVLTSGGLTLPVLGQVVATWVGSSV